MILASIVADTWTQADADKLRAAILALACGEAVQTVVYAGPPQRSMTYMPRDLPAMRSLLADIVAAVASAAGATRFRHAKFRKGFRDDETK